MIKIKRLLITIFLGVILAMPVLAIATPAKTVINPVTETVYVVDNSQAKINIYQAKSSNPLAYWNQVTNQAISLPAGSQCFGLAVWQSGSTGKLLLSINDPISSKLRYYKLGSDGLPVDVNSPKDYSFSLPSVSPMGIAITSSNADYDYGDYAYVLDNNNALVFGFAYNTSTDQWQELGYHKLPYYGLYDIVTGTSQNIYGTQATSSSQTTPLDSNTYSELLGGSTSPVGQLTQTLVGFKQQIFISVKETNGKVLAYDFIQTQNTIEAIPSGEVAVYQPTNLQLGASGTKLYVAANGATGGDIKIYDVNNTYPTISNSQVKTIYSGINQTSGWTDFGLNSNGQHVFFSQRDNTLSPGTTYVFIAKNVLDSPTDKYFNGSTDASHSTNKSVDGLVLGKYLTRLGLASSADGSLTELKTNFNNNAPYIDSTSKEQLKLDKTTTVADGGKTDEKQIIAKFKVVDKDQNDKLTPYVRYRKKVSGTFPNTWTVVTGEVTTPGATVMIPIPLSSEATPDGEYEWAATVSDGIYTQTWQEYIIYSGQTDFIIDTGAENPTITLTHEATRGNIFWISIPYNNPYTKASDILAEISIQNGGTKSSGDVVNIISKWKTTANKQGYETYTYYQSVNAWGGSDFPIVSGDAIAISTLKNVKFKLKGSHDKSFKFNLPYSTQRGNLFWISVPYNGDFTNAASIVADINKNAGLSATSGSQIDLVGRWNSTKTSQNYETYVYYKSVGSWAKNNFKFKPGEAISVNIKKDFKTWQPKVK